LNPKTQNRYIYVINNPLEFIDNTGYKPKLSISKLSIVASIVDATKEITIDLPQEGQPGASRDSWYEDLLEAAQGLFMAIGGLALIFTGAVAVPSLVTIPEIIGGAALFAAGTSKIAIQIADIFVDW